jgi:hypothetical protein
MDWKGRLERRIGKMGWKGRLERMIGKRVRNGLNTSLKYDVRNLGSDNGQ